MLLGLKYPDKWVLSCMKRLNPVTEQVFTRGDLREDGYVFYKYTRILKLDGTFKEIWLSPEAMRKEKNDDRNRKNKTYERKSNRLPKGWASKLRNKYWVDHCRELWHKMCQKPMTKEKLEILCAVPLVFDLLLPFTSDYGN